MPLIMARRSRHGVVGDGEYETSVGLTVGLYSSIKIHSNTVTSRDLLQSLPPPLTCDTEMKRTKTNKQHFRALLVHLELRDHETLWTGAHVCFGEHSLV